MPPNSHWLRASRALDIWVSRVSLVLAWIIVLALVITSGIDVLGRQIYHVSDDAINTIMAALFLNLAVLFIGLAYLRDAHVRIDIVRDKLSPRMRSWIELFGNIVVLLPICIIFIISGGNDALSALRQGELVEGVGSLPLMWLIEASIPSGFLLLLLAVISITIRNVLFLCGKITAPDLIFKRMDP